MIRGLVIRAVFDLAALTLLLVAGALALAACGSTESPSSTASSISPRATAFPSPAANPLNLPSDEVVAAVEGRIGAWMRKDWQAAASYYAEDGTLVEMDADPSRGSPTEGREAIGQHLKDLYLRAGFRAKSVALPLQYERYVADPMRLYWADGSDGGGGMAVFELTTDNKFACQWFFSGASSKRSPPFDKRLAPTPMAQLTTRPNLPSQEVMSLLEDHLTALNRGDGEAAASHFFEDGVMVEIGGRYHYGSVVTPESAQIAARVASLHDQGMRLESAGPPIQYESIVAEPVRFLQTDGSTSGVGMLVFDIGAHNKIAWQWVIGAPWMASQ